MNTTSPKFASLYKDYAEYANYEDVSKAFLDHHKDPFSVLLHLVTTPIGLIGMFSLLRRCTKSSSISMGLVFFYLLSLIPIVPVGDFLGSFLLCGFILLFSRLIDFGWVYPILMLVAGYTVQDLIHLVANESTYQSSYSNGGEVDYLNLASWGKLFLVHIYYLVPFCVHAFSSCFFSTYDVSKLLEAPIPKEIQSLHAWGWLVGTLMCFALGSYCLDSKNSLCFFPGTPYFYRVLQCNMMDTTNEEDGDKADKDMVLLRDWTMAHNPPENTSSHWWYRDLNGDAKAAFDRCADSNVIKGMFRSLFGDKHYALDIVTGMNEIYVSGPSRESEIANSDQVFYTRHVDGPYGFVPFCSVYRCIVGLDRNLMITTHFPLAGLSHNACKGDVLAFDFNREVHYISSDESKKDLSDKFRVTLKLHYCVYPRVLAPLGWLMNFLNTRYNMSFRALFLKTITPHSIYEHFLALNVNFNTFLFDRIETLFGLRNMAYLFFVSGLWYVG